MSFRRYESTSDSGLRWLGELPSEWRLVPFWTLFRRTKRTGFPDEELLSVYRDYGVIRKQDRDDNFNKPSEDLSQYQLVEQGDLAINKMKAWQGSLGVSPYRGIVSPAYFVYKACHSEFPGFLHYLLRSAPYAVGFMTISKGIRINQWDVDPEHLAQLPVPLPSRAEQSLIATFLDRETAKIDALVEEQRRLIGLLHEKRQAIISHAVTKGLEPNAPMKESGVEWLGEVPAHWTVRRLSRVVDMAEGQVDPREEPYASMILIAPNHIEAGTGRVLYQETAADQGADSGKYRFEAGDVIYSKIRPALAKVAIAPSDGLCSADMYPLKPRDDLSRGFLKWTLLSAGFTAWAVLESDRVAMPKINREKLNSLALPVPPLSDQLEIEKHIARHVAQYEALIDQSGAAIAILQERRSALISAAVTGKIDVRGDASVQAEAA